MKTGFKVLPQKVVLDWIRTLPSDFWSSSAFRSKIIPKIKWKESDYFYSIQFYSRDGTLSFKDQCLKLIHPEIFDYSENGIREKLKLQRNLWDIENLTIPKLHKIDRRLTHGILKILEKYPKFYTLKQKILHFLGEVDLLFEVPTKDKAIPLLRKYIKEIDSLGRRKSGIQRSLCKNNKFLYEAVFKYSKEMDEIPSVTFFMRIRYILGDINLICEKCGNKKTHLTQGVRLTDRKKTKDFGDCYTLVCKFCKPPNPATKDFYKLIYGKRWLKEYKKRSESRKNKIDHLGNKQGSLGWYIAKYGETEGTTRFTKRFSSNHNQKNYSKRSQDFFRRLVSLSKLNPSLCFFAENNGELILYLNREEQKILNQSCIKIDFCIQKKVIEYQGGYWHSSQEQRKKDLLKKKILNLRGFECLYVWEDNEDQGIKEALYFLNKDRFLLETPNGHKAFYKVQKKEPSQILKIKLESTEVRVTRGHSFIVNNTEVKAKDLKIGDYLETRDGIEVVKEIIECGLEETYDIVEVENHLYYANDVLSHNCSFLGSSFALIPDEILDTYKIKNPIDTDIRGQLKVYENPIPKHKYIIGVDSSKEGQDFTGIQIFDITDLMFRQVASAKLKIDYLMVPEILYEYGNKFNQALIIVENNEGSGQSIADILARAYEYDNVFYEYKVIRGVRKRLGYPGFRTTRLTRDLLLQVLRMLATSNRLSLCDSDTIKEFESFVLVNNKYQANGVNAHDDLVMATLMCFAVFKDSKTFEDIKIIIDGLKSGDSINEELIGNVLAFSDFGDEGMVGRIDYLEFTNGL